MPVLHHVSCAHYACRHAAPHPTLDCLHSQSPVPTLPVPSFLSIISCKHAFKNVQEGDDEDIVIEYVTQPVDLSTIFSAPSSGAAAAAADGEHAEGGSAAAEGREEQDEDEEELAYGGLGLGAARGLGSTAGLGAGGAEEQQQQQPTLVSAVCRVGGRTVCGEAGCWWSLARLGTSGGVRGISTGCWWRAAFCGQLQLLARRLC